MTHRSIRCSTLLLCLALIAMPLVVAAQQPRTDAPPAAWDSTTYEALAARPMVAPPDGPVPTPADRPQNRLVAPGAYDLHQLLGLPTVDIVEQAQRKITQRNALRDRLAGQVGDDLTDLGFNAVGANADPAIFGATDEDAGLGDRGFRITSSGLLELDLDRRAIHSAERSEVILGDIKLTADRLRIDVDLQIVDAAGNVILENPRTGLVTTGSAIVFDFANFVGIMRHETTRVSVVTVGQSPFGDGSPKYRQLTERLTVLDDAWMTTNNFEVPSYRIQGTEVVLVREERLFIHNAVLYVRGLPIFYFPYYSIYLGEEVFPWSVRIGNASSNERELGYFATVSYDYYHRVVDPSFERPGTYRQRTLARFSPMVFFAEESYGAGIDARYDYFEGRHRGEWFAFATPELDERNEALDEDETERWAVDFKHRTRLTRDLDILFNVDWVSDSEVYFDYTDQMFGDGARGRRAERRALAALTWRRDDYLARVLVENKERLARDRPTNFGEAGDDDDDYSQFVNDPPFWVLNEEGFFETEGFGVIPEDQIPEDVDPKEEQINRDRFGQVTERRPELRFITSRLPVWKTPFFYTLDVRAYDNLDKGLNSLSTEDDSFVQGIDAYNSLMTVINFSEQYSWSHRIGLGVGIAERDDDSFNLIGTRVRGISEETEFPLTLPNGMILADDQETIQIGDQQVRLADVENQYYYTDYESILRGDFSENLTGRLRYRLREGTEDTLGEFYSKLGTRNHRDDLFDYRLRQHRLDGSLVYDFIYPRIRTSIDAGTNFDSGDDLHPGEQKNFVSGSAEWRSLSDEWRVSALSGLYETQNRYTGSEFEYTGRSVASRVQVDYFPLHERYWAQVRGSHFRDLETDPLEDFINENPLDPNLGNRDSDTDDDDRYQIEPVFGFRAGPKYEIELQARYDTDEEDFDRIRLMIQRDLNDAVFSFGAEWTLDDVNNNERLEDNDDLREEPEYERELKLRWGLAFKLPNRDRFSGPLATEIVVSQRRSEIELGG